MNVAFDPWVPVVTTSGKPDLASLCDVLAKGEQFVDLAVRPHERVALMRLFLCVAHAALNGPKDYDEWCEAPERLPEAVQKYLTDWKGSFELFHKEKPWLQVAGLSKAAKGETPQIATEDWTPVSKLNFSFATGNNTTLFDHGGMSENRNITLGETLLSMLTFQCFSPGGLISQVYWNGKQSGKSSKDGPCVPASMIHAFLRGKNLSGTIYLNLPTYEDILFSYGERDFGKPVWEMMPTSMTDSVRVENATATYVGRLVPMTRLICLHPSYERMLLGDGLVYPPFTAGFPPEPTATVVIIQKGGEEERAILSYQPTKALWRELAAVVVKRKAEGPGGPLSLRAIQDGKGCDLIVAALARDKATIVDVVESVFHVPSRLHSNEGTVTYDAEVKTAEATASRLGWAVEIYRKEIDHGWEGRLKGAGPGKWTLKAKLHSIATSHYWTTVEKKLQLLMSHIEAIGTDAAIPTREAWRKMLFSFACEAYRISCGQETPRQMRAFAKGWQKLTVARDEPERNINKTTEVKV
ncbi:MAG: type I-E CRISPR-associated protein Cse1/CasA [Deltaproteobacteria bacterium]|uniref:Type I-E CRISPR-associated protein Cse1/CasA n=1 Tax=Candidatus Desulfacyla euxinica TaxID=2841693 RepID=A0A8J6T8G0_9DELT|nr:type I-E CRISPR-associated protein Cse1/CasA [Candidatus Desulfacyla euxinica]